jgi:hydroxymethylglutaryl-CoA reductase (NADPH)
MIVLNKDMSKGLDKLLKGEVKPHALAKELGISEAEAVGIRRVYLYETRGLDLDGFLPFEGVDYDDAAKRGLTNALGHMGGGPILSFFEAANLLKDGSAEANSKRPFFYATTEGFMGPGLMRGVSAVEKSGGVTVEILDDKMTRSVGIVTPGAEYTKAIEVFANSSEGFAFLESVYNRVSSHSQLRDVEVHTTDDGNAIALVFIAPTGAAMGMNMLTEGANGAVKAMLKERIIPMLNGMGIYADEDTFGVIASGNLCTDKKVSRINNERGRGLTLRISANISESIITGVLKATPDGMEMVGKYKNNLFSDIGGVMGRNSAIANPVSAMFLAYGQDTAQVVGPSAGNVSVTMNGDKSLTVTVDIPVLEVATIGGGTFLPLPRALLTATGVYGRDDHEGVSKRLFGSYLGAIVTGYEVNALAALSTDHLTSAHRNALEANRSGNGAAQRASDLASEKRQ